MTSHLNPDTPVGIREIASALGVERNTVDQWRTGRRGGMPDPDWTVGGRPAWHWATIRTWAIRTGRLVAGAEDPVTLWVEPTWPGGWADQVRCDRLLRNVGFANRAIGVAGLGIGWTPIAHQEIPDGTEPDAFLAAMLDAHRDELVAQIDAALNLTGTVFVEWQTDGAGRAAAVLRPVARTDRGQAHPGTMRGGIGFRGEIRDFDDTGDDVAVSVATDFFERLPEFTHEARAQAEDRLLTRAGLTRADVFATIAALERTDGNLALPDFPILPTDLSRG